MQVLLAGYNVDAEVLAELTKDGDRKDVTPETLSASYARISRDPRPVNELRKVARQEVEKARRSNQNIIFKMGHHSVAEHAVFNFDLIDISRLALEEVEKFRLCSYTEKSQRYQKLEDNLVIPDEIRNLTVPAGRQELEISFANLIKRQNSYYQELINKGVDPEDARYVTSLATVGQVGLTINARNLELLFRRFASHPLSEVKQLGREMYRLIEKIAPSIILFTEANPYDEKTYPELRNYFARKWEKKKRKGKLEVELVDYTEKADLKLVAALLHSSSGISFRNCWRMVKDMNWKEREEIIRLTGQHMEFYDVALREFEHISLTYDLLISAAGFGQLKRHRMATLTSQRYDPHLGVTIPPRIIETGEKERFLEVIKETEKVYQTIAESDPVAAQYVLTNAHRKRVLMTVNARELYHISRLREDLHAQWDIRSISGQMTDIARKVMPLTMLLIGGKDKYPEIYQQIYQRPPKILPPKE